MFAAARIVADARGTRDEYDKIFTSAGSMGHYIQHAIGDVADNS
jgi:hypothetical protein